MKKLGYLLVLVFLMAATPFYSAHAISDPSQLSGLKLWLDASDPTTLTASSTAAPPALGNITSSTTIGSWFDKSNNGNTFSQSSTSSEPTYYSSGGHIGNGAYLDFENAATHINGTGPYLQERVANLYNTLGSSNTVLMLMYKNNTPEGSYQVLFTNNTGGPGAEFLIHQNGNLERFNAGSTAALSEGAIHALAYSFNSGNNAENFYIDSAAAPSFTANAGRPSIQSQPFELSDGGLAMNGEVYQVLIYNRELSNSEIAQIYAYWNSKYGTSFNASAGPLLSPSVSVTNVSKTGQTLVAASPSGGTSPYSYQWYRSATNGTAASIAVSGNALSGATGLTYSDSGLTAQTHYYYVLKVTDSAGTPATVLSPVLDAPTHGNTTVKIAFIGDSITAGANSATDPATQFALAMQAAYPNLDVQVTNMGHSGEYFRSYSRVNSGGGNVTNLISTLQGAGIHYVSIMEGTNDWNAGGASYTPATYKTDMQDVTSALTQAGITTYVNQMIYRTAAGADDPTTGIRGWNTQIASTSLSYSGLLRQGDTNGYAFFQANPSDSYDGLHPNTPGSIALGQLWEAAIAPSMVSDISPPTISSVTSSSSASSATISWTTNKAASTKVHFGFGTNYSSTTPETDTSSRVTSHAVTLPGLLGCTLYHFQVESIDASSNDASSTDNTLQTAGCVGNATVSTSTSATITTGAGGNITLANTTITVPTNFVSASTTATFQASQVDPTAFFASASAPSGKTAVGNTVVTIQAYSSATTTLHVFNQPVTVTMQYNPSDIIGLSSASLTIYRYDAGTGWTALTGCAVDTNANTVSCQTSNFSSFSIFGTTQSSGNSGSGFQFGSGGNSSPSSGSSSVSGSSGISSTVTYGCKDPMASNYNYFSSSKPSLCMYGSKGTTVAVAPSGSTAPTATFTRDLKKGMSGTDVESLQKILSALNSGPAASALTKNGFTLYFGSLTQAAVIEYQKAMGIAPAAGYFGALTRARITTKSS